MSSCIRGLTPARDELDNEDDEEGLDVGAGIISWPAGIGATDWVKSEEVDAGVAISGVDLKKL